jgi:hypothetical protein
MSRGFQYPAQSGQVAIRRKTLFYRGAIVGKRCYVEAC